MSVITAHYTDDDMTIGDILSTKEWDINAKFTGKWDNAFTTP